MYANVAMIPFVVMVAPFPLSRFLLDTTQLLVLDYVWR
jgi:hypothetical protein